MRTRLSEEVEPIETVKLTGKDIEDAKRLLWMLSAAAERQTAIVPLACPQAQPAADLLAKAREILADRSRRASFFGRSMFSEHAWEILLYLYALDSGARQNLSRLAELSGTSKSTALRWLAYLEQHDLVRRTAHPTDKRVSFVELTDTGKARLEAYLAETIATNA